MYNYVYNIYVIISELCNPSAVTKISVDYIYYIYKNMYYVVCVSQR